VNFDRLRLAVPRNLEMSHVVWLARTLELAPFRQHEKGRAVLLIRLDFDAAALSADLVQRYGVEDSRAKAVGTLDFQTVMVKHGDGERTFEGARSIPPGLETETMMRWVSVAPCFAVPIAKSSGVFSERIAVGRAPNKDIVLRSKHISKSHAWFEWNAAGMLCLADAGSRNGTTVAGTSLEPRVPRAVRDGEDIRLGRLETTVCSGQLFWHLAQIT